MRDSSRQGFGVGVLAVLLGTLSATAIEAKMVPKVESFILFVDQSGSMYMHHEGMRATKMKLAKSLLAELNGTIPELGYQGALSLLAPYQEISTSAVFQQKKFEEHFQRIKDDQEIFDRMTPMGPGIHSLDKTLAAMNGKVAVILISDGMANMGTDPVMESTAIHNKYPNVCFHTISFAEEAKGRAIMKKISDIGDCVVAEGTDLLGSKSALDKFVRDVFYDEVADRPAKKDEDIVLRHIQFDFDKFNIGAEWKAVLDQNAAILRENADVNVIIEGHTDGIGSEQYNQRLSQRRAQSVYDYFVSKRISRSRMKTVGYGKTKPLTTNPGDQDQSMNRRVEIKVSR